MKEIANIISKVYIDLYTQAIFLHINLYNPNQDLWTALVLMVEVCPTGTFFPYPAYVRNFKLDIYSGDGVIIKSSDIIKGIICTLLLFFILYYVVN